MRVRAASAFLLLAVLALAAACFSMRKSSGGGQTTFSGRRTVRPEDVALPEGYRIEAVAEGLTFPTGVAFDDSGRAFVVESGYSYGEVWTTPRLLRVESGGRTSVVATGEDNGPWNGVAFSRGSFYVAEGGERRGGAILKISADGKIARLVEGLPSLGDHHTDGPAVAPDGTIYFGQGTATNSAVVGVDNAQFGWLKRHPDFHDIPCRDVTLAGRNFSSENPLQPGSAAKVETGAFSPFGTPTRAGQVIRGEVPCNGAILRVSPEGGKPELVAWGFRNPFGLAFAPDGQLYVTENAFDVRGSRPVFGTGDVLWAVRPGLWYGWPDYHAGRRLDIPGRFTAPGKPVPVPLLATPPNEPPHPAAILGVHSSSNGFDFSRNPAFGDVGDAFIAQFGDMAPNVGKTTSPVGFKIVRVTVADGLVRDFAANKGTANGPASRVGSGGLERPVAARFTPDGTALYVVDFGVLTMGGRGPEPRERTGVLWRITRAGGGGERRKAGGGA
ncbi:MAG TPA: glucose dehydrogenase [Thermoanaerobaculia bacterium]